MITIVSHKVVLNDSRKIRRLSLTIKDTSGEFTANELAATVSAALCYTVLSTKKVAFFPNQKRDYVTKMVIKFKAESSITAAEIGSFVDSLQMEIDKTDLGFNKKTRP